ncbi:guanine deaminase [Radiomyces spectabilis]|uniref:guanine deaminase n=1 Tax=Radiomyces spectabilis TaxID=64574 RepID=UPI00221FD76F|nr:guanine deaminase [Radiomyces spectabilis]KAI8393497.1 guanine deaminase [Radiomyces spectabilis]
MSPCNVFYGTLVHSLSITELEIITNGVLVVDNGVIVHMERNVEDVDAYLQKNEIKDYNLHRLNASQFIVPGFVDTHAHAPQYVFTGSGMDMQLLEWLNTYVFPTETAFKNVEHADKAYTTAVSRFLRNGTTTCSWFATIHLEACQKLTDIIENLGQRAYIGKVNMDQNAPDFYIEETDASLKNTRTFVEYVQKKESKLLTPVVTPRFAITCSSRLMNGLSEIAKEYDVPIQTHLCENPDEIQFTCSLFPESKDYTAIYDDHNLLGEKSYMAHCVHMTDDEIKMLADRKTGISHCANSNFSLHSGVCDVRRFMESGVKVGLGTDVAGGFAPSMLDAIRSTFFASKTIKVLKRDGMLKGGDDYVPLSPAELLYLATMGGAKVLGLQDTIGNFEKGKAFDALWVDLENDGGVDLMGMESPYQKVQKFLFNGSDKNLLHVYVQGRRVAGAASA